MKPLTHRQLMLVLAISLGLNLFLGGFWAARWGVRGMHRGHAPQHDSPEHGFETGLSDSPGLRRVLRDRAELGTKRDALRQARRDAYERFRAPTFERDAASLALSGLRKESLALQEGVHAALLEAAAGMTVEERRELMRPGRRHAEPR